MIAMAHELSDPGEEAAVETDHAASPFHGSKTGGTLRNQSPLRNLPRLESRANGRRAFLGRGDLWNKPLWRGRSGSIDWGTVGAVFGAGLPRAVETRQARLCMGLRPVVPRPSIASPGALAY